MQKLSKQHLTDRDTLVEALADLYNTLEEAVTQFNDAQSEAWSEVETAMNAYNEKLAEANEWLEEVSSAIQEFMEDKSEKWQESARGQAYDTWRQEFEQTLEEVDLQEPDGLELLEGDQGQTLPDLPEEVDLS